MTATRDPLLCLLELLYEVPLHPAGAARFTEALCRLTGAHAAGFTVDDHEDDALQSRLLWTGFGAAFANDYERHFYRLDPWRAPNDVTPVRRSFASDELVARQAFETSEFYRDFGRVHGLQDFQNIVLVRTATHRVVLGAVFETRRASAERHRELLETLAPHLVRVFSILHRLDEVGREARVAGELPDQLSLGVVQLDQRSQALAVNRQAEAFFCEKDGLDLRDRVLVGADGPILAGTSRELRENTARIVVRRPSGRRPYVLTRVPLPREGGVLSVGTRAAAVVYIVDPELGTDPPAMLLQRMFGLTSAEARLALLVGRGLTPKEAADKLGKSLHTVRFQLAQVFAKTQTNRQATLVGLLSSLGTRVHPMRV